MSRGAHTGLGSARETRAVAAAAAHRRVGDQTVAFGTDGDGPPPQFPVRAVMTLDEACARMPEAMAVLARSVALHDRIAGSDDLFLHLLHERANRIGLGKLARACADLAERKG